jgi:muramoyltetrapeptide carboxypeptidase
MLPKDKPIAVVAPSGVYQLDRFEAGLGIIQDHGLETRVPEDILQPVRYLAGSDEHRLDQLTSALQSNDFGAVWVARGGYGITRLLSRLPWDTLPDRPVIGFSDVTALLQSMWQHRRCVGIHGPVVHSLSNTSPEAVEHLFDLLNGKAVAPLRGETWAPGDVSGPLVGGNLCMLASLCGTPHQLRTLDSILVLEEIAEAPYKIDRMLVQLIQSGCLKGLKGVAVGELLNCDPPGSASWSNKDIFLEHLQGMGVPVIGNLPIGHGKNNYAFPVGKTGYIRHNTLSWDP